MTAAEAAAYLSVSIETIRQRAINGELTGYKLGSGPSARWRFKLADLNAFLTKGSTDGRN